MSDKLRSILPPDTVKGALDAAQRALIRFLQTVVKAESWQVDVADVAAGYLVGKIHHVYKKWHEQPMRRTPTPTRTGCKVVKMAPCSWNRVWGD
ncbi:hypothetical protein N7475_007164 [Penicillium sp. IBT 31633x]|nr:hypothetical protein N7475_007164 [Penicillium sp. IBT 31633x]